MPVPCAHALQIITGMFSQFLKSWDGFLQETPVWIVGRRDRGEIAACIPQIYSSVCIKRKGLSAKGETNAEQGIKVEARLLVREASPRK